MLGDLEVGAGWSGSPETLRCAAVRAEPVPGSIAWLATIFTATVAPAIKVTAAATSTGNDRFCNVTRGCFEGDSVVVGGMEETVEGARVDGARVEI